jgi:TonB family protein
MQMKATLIFLLFTVTNFVRAQDTLYFDVKNKRVISMDSASSYKIYTPDKNRKGNLIEITYSKMGKIKSSCSLYLKFKRNANKAIVESYTSGKITWNDPSIQEYVEKINDGTYKAWYENGNLYKEIEYKEGKMNGHYISYWENGQIKREEFIGGDKLVEGKCFDYDGNEIKHTPMEQMPEFPGGEEKLMDFLSQNIEYPIVMRDEKVQGTVFVKFTVGKDGSLFNIRIFRSLHFAGDEEAIRVIKLMPNWKPAILEGEPVSSTCFLPITFKLTEKYKTFPFRRQNINSQF